MKQEIYHKKIVFWLRFAGWLCLLPASAWLYLWQFTSGLGFAGYSYLFLTELTIIVLFAVFLLTTANSAKWEKVRNVLLLLVFALLFISIIIVIPLYFAYRNCRKLND
ncbi:hypothetical protein OZX69_09235 [Lactobacillus sp. ESL0731]|uniref:hypothetical protein n=1 Tax=unclassified Lactobacillus TaxID=2620435 RepID=UPI0023F7DAE4|nr:MULTISPECIES: hypothetical protein [unclassified Lactobacillus]WEV51116.1 hypothetical protein OZX63_09235 [Lactobacillus sp. ESL0700]WEV62245.1 hypothetical protein OZX69_09235 [Lactobacillus sp. ESL0731]